MDGVNRIAVRLFPAIVRSLASVVVQDTGDASTALFLVPQEFESAYNGAIDELSQQTAMKAWIWQTGSQGLPALPERMVGRNDRP